MKVYNVVDIFGVDRGMIPEDRLRDAYMKGQFLPRTIVWTQGMDNWATLEQVFGPPPPPPPSQATAAPPAKTEPEFHGCLPLLLFQIGSVATAGLLDFAFVISLFSKDSLMDDLGLGTTIVYLIVCNGLAYFAIKLNSFIKKRR